MEYLEINSTFEFKGKSLKVVETSTRSCEGCALVVLDCANLNCKGLLCAAAHRKDNKNVIFEEQKVIWKYHDLHSTFKHEGKTLKVVEATAGCRGCHFFDNKGKCDVAYPCYCIPDYRFDNTSIIYQEVSQLKSK